MKLLRDIATTILILVVGMACWLLIPIAASLIVVFGLGFIIYLCVSEDEDTESTEDTED